MTYYKIKNGDGITVGGRFDSREEAKKEMEKLKEKDKMEKNGREISLSNLHIFSPGEE